MNEQSAGTEKDTAEPKAGSGGLLSGSCASATLVWRKVKAKLDVGAIQTGLTVNERGDWEQRQAALFQLVDYTHLYVLGAAGQSRQMVQIFNQYDNCCFWGLRYQTYEDDVAATVNGAGPGKFAVWLDSTTRDQHVISAWALARIAEALQ